MMLETLMGKMKAQTNKFEEMTVALTDQKIDNNLP
jgi:hypothetical protein